MPRQLISQLGQDLSFILIEPKKGVRYPHYHDNQFCIQNILTRNVWGQGLIWEHKQRDRRVHLQCVIGDYIWQPAHCDRENPF